MANKRRVLEGGGSGFLVIHLRDRTGLRPDPVWSDF